MDYKEALLKSLEEENKDKSVKLALEALNTGKIIKKETRFLIMKQS